MGGIYENKVGEERDGDFDKKEGVKVKYALPYSERKGRQDCASYLETGFCSYRYKCCYNHPPQIANQFNSKSSWDYDDTYEQEYVNNGSQYSGLPVRQGQKDCPYYMKHGSCKYSIDCRFNHPNHFIIKHDLPEEFEKNEYIENNDPLNYEDSSPPCLNESLSENSASSDFLPVDIKSMILPKYECDLPPNIKAMLLPPQRLHDTEQVPETYEGYSMESNTTKSNSSQQIEDPFEYLESPGKQECDYYINHGYCKFKSICKFNHPRDQLLKDYGGRNSRNGTNKTRSYDAVETEECLMKLRQKGLMDQQFTTQAYREGNLNGDRKEKKKEIYPERPGKPECGYYMKHGDCKFKFTCKFHHPKDPYQKERECLLH